MMWITYVSMWAKQFAYHGFFASNYYFASFRLPDPIAERLRDVLGLDLPGEN